MTQTPLQEAIERIEAGDPKYCTPAEVVSILESLLPKEKEFVGKCFDAGEVKGWFHEGPSIKPGPPPPDKQQFIDKYYSK